MLDKGLKKYFINPCWGLIPYLIYVVLFHLTDNILNSLIISLLFSIVTEFILRLYLKSTRIILSFLLSFCGLATTLMILMLFGREFTAENAYVIIPEIIIVSLLVLIHFIKPFLHIRFFKQDNALQKAFMNEFFWLASIIQYFFTFHIFIVLIYEFAKESNVLTNVGDPIFYCWVPAIFIATLFLYEHFSIMKIVEQLKHEDWLPIVNEDGDVSGKIAKSISERMGNKYMHPVVRIALVCNGKLYLKERADNDINSYTLLDHPFEKYVLFEQDINTVANDCVAQTMNGKSSLRFLTKYVFKNHETKKLIFFYISRIKSEDEIEKSNLKNGKFWSIKQIESDFDTKNIFSECFKSEYKFLKDMVLSIDENLKNMGIP